MAKLGIAVVVAMICLRRLQPLPPNAAQLKVNDCMTKKLGIPSVLQDASSLWQIVFFGAKRSSNDLNNTMEMAEQWIRSAR